ncbi:hypothetical protein [Thalassobellus suaedae]|uniref:DUF3185 domain-containing protein n=1 Tax=Thalassobellus suaedae TaxID=3074124 RepID=A0ABY9XTN6_9FLAO|nr:hypothetical protein RHP51_00840 [Flavobacteriaceae bacterium HL-DH14]
MNKMIKTILTIVGVGLIAYGIYTMIVPETVLSIGDLDIGKVHDNDNSYISIGLGLSALIISIVGEKILKI